MDAFLVSVGFFLRGLVGRNPEFFQISSQVEIKYFLAFLHF